MSDFEQIRKTVDSVTCRQLAEAPKPPLWCDAEATREFSLIREEEMINRISRHGHLRSDERQ